MLKLGMYIVLYSITWTCNVFASQEGDLIVAIDAKKVLSSIFESDVQYSDVNKCGVNYFISKNENHGEGTVRIAVFESIEKTRKVFDDKIWSISVGPDRDLSGEIGQQGVMWKTHLIFIRDNVFAEIIFHENELELAAKELDSALVSKVSGVNVGNAVNLPVIKDIDIVNDVPRAYVESNIVGFTVLVDRFGAECHESRIDAVYFITDGCVVSDPRKCDQAYLNEKRANSANKGRVDPAKHVEVAGKAKDYLDILASDESTPLQLNAALLAAAKAKDRNSISLVMKCVDERYGVTVRQSAIRALGEIGGPEAVAMLTKILEIPIAGDITDEGENEAVLRRHAVISLGNIGGDLSLSTLKKIAESDEEYKSVSEFAAVAVRKLETEKGLILE